MDAWQAFNVASAQQGPPLVWVAVLVATTLSVSAWACYRLARRRRYLAAALRNSHRQVIPPRVHPPPNTPWLSCDFGAAAEGLLAIVGDAVAPEGIGLFAVQADRQLFLVQQWRPSPAERRVALLFREGPHCWPDPLWQDLQTRDDTKTTSDTHNGVEEPPYLKQTTPTSDAMVIPIEKGTDIFGLLVLHRTHGSPFTDKERLLAERVANALSLSADLETRLAAQKREADAHDQALARMEHLATHDGLTGLVNQRHFRALFDSYLAQAERYQRRLSLVMLDIDHFKDINDQHGHPMGDLVLKTIASILQSSARRADIVARLGGEEFAILMEETGLGGAHSIAERVRRSVESTVVTTQSGDIRATLSLGIASFPDHGHSKKELTEHADKALYVAKRMGRNRTVLSTAKRSSEGLTQR